MLVLTRKPNERIMIGSDIVVVVLDVRGNQVRIGVKAPAGIKIHRHQIFERIQLSNQSLTEPQEITNTAE